MYAAAEAAEKLSGVVMGNVNSVSALLFIIVFGISFFVASTTGSILIGVVGFIIAALLFTSIKLANQWERVVILKLGRFHSVRGPGIFFIIPIINTIADFIDLRTITTEFTAEKTLTKDNVPVDVNAILFWRVVDPKMAVLEVEHYKEAISLASQTALRDTIGKKQLSEMLIGREEIDTELQKTIGKKVKDWGVDIHSVEIRDVVIPQELQNAMSRQAQAERERQARVILGESEMQIAEKFQEAAKYYQNNPTAMHLRAMNMLYEGLKEKGALIIVPSSAVETMGLGGLSGLTALGMEEMKKKGKK